MDQIKSALRSDSFYSSEFSNTNYMAAKHLSALRESPRDSSLKKQAKTKKNRMINLKPINDEKTEKIRMIKEIHIATKSQRL